MHVTDIARRLDKSEGHSNLFVMADKNMDEVSLTFSSPTDTNINQGKVKNHLILKSPSQS